MERWRWRQRKREFTHHKQGPRFHHTCSKVRISGFPANTWLFFAWFGFLSLATNRHGLRQHPQNMIFFISTNLCYKNYIEIHVNFYPPPNIDNFSCRTGSFPKLTQIYNQRLLILQIQIISWKGNQRICLHLWWKSTVLRMSCLMRIYFPLGCTLL